MLDEHDDRVTGLFDRSAGLTTQVEREIKADPKQHISKRLQHLGRNQRKVAA